jgi:hypothetical protein
MIPSPELLVSYRNLVFCCWASLARSTMTRSGKQKVSVAILDSQSPYTFAQGKPVTSHTRRMIAPTAASFSSMRS